MDSATAFMLGDLNRHKERKVFDWDLAAKTIKDRGIKNATAGLKLDMEWTSDIILLGGKPQEGRDCYLASTWAIPILVDDDTGNEYECFIMKSKTKYDEHTKWPESALAILGFTEKDIETESEYEDDTE